MKKWVFVAIAVVVVLAVFWHLRKKHQKPNPSFFPLTPATAKPSASLWKRASKTPGTKSPFTVAPTRSPATTKAPYAMSGIPTVSPVTVPPFTLGPVPNGLTRTPEPPTLRPAEGVEFAGAEGSLYDSPAPARATSISGIQVPPVQNPWEVKNWQFLVGVDAKTALDIVSNLFPSFPISARSASEPPSMSGAIVLKTDSAGKVVSVVRD